MITGQFSLFDIETPLNYNEKFQICKRSITQFKPGKSEYVTYLRLTYIIACLKSYLGAEDSCEM
jgi:hypothetical protein